MEDSYFGVIGHSFYGGPNGQNFSIKQIFKTKTELNDDIALQFRSPVQVGEFVIISYGDPHTSEYNTNRNADLNNFGTTYNATLWQKTFTDTNGLTYKNISSLEADMPYINFAAETLDPGDYFPPSERYVLPYGTSVYSNELCTEELEKAEKTYQVTVTPTTSTYVVQISYNKGTEEEPELITGYTQKVNIVKYTGYIIETEDSTNVDKHYLLSLPNVWDIQKGTDSGTISASQNARVEIDGFPDADKTGSPSTTTKYIHIKVPNAWNIQKGTITYTDSDIEPDVSINNKQFPPDGPESASIKYIHFSLPKPWTFVTNTSVVGANVNPSVVQTIETINDEKVMVLTFSLPKPWNFITDTELSAPGSNPNVSIASNPTTGQQTLTFSLPRQWNFDVDNTTSLNPNEQPSVSTYTSEGTVYFEFQLPVAWDFEVSNVTPLPANANPTVEITDNTEETAKILSFGLPVSQIFQEGVSITQLTPLATATGQITYSETDTLKREAILNLQLPRASQIRWGTYFNTLSSTTIYRNSIGDSAWNRILGPNPQLNVGDYYINTILGAVHYITAVNNDSITSICQGTIQPSLPRLRSNSINPYDSNGNPVTPTFATSSIDTNGNWVITINTPTAPRLTLNSNSKLVSSLNTTQGISSNVDSTGISFLLRIPKGTTITTENSVSDATAWKSSHGTLEDYEGDLFLTNDGWIQRLTNEGWKNDIQIKGKSFLIKNPTAIAITEEDLTNYEGNNLYQRMGAWLSDPNNPNVSYSQNLLQNEVLNITYQETGDPNITSHWLFKVGTTSPTWSGSQLTGSISNSIVVNTITEDTTNLTYSTTITNALRTQVNYIAENMVTANDAITKAYSITIAQSGWTLDENENKYINTIMLPEALHCGAANATVPVPPMVIYNNAVSNNNKIAYGLIEKFELYDNDDSDKNKKITFYVDASNINHITDGTDISVIVIDYR